MSLINHEELKKQIKDGTFTSLDDITNEFKNILKEVIQTASSEELTSHLGYEKHQLSDTPNYRNGYNDKKINSKYLFIRHFYYIKNLRHINQLFWIYISP
jgi:putative transposase